jgi:quercetin dioxygenase-like cupin family protein
VASERSASSEQSLIGPEHGAERLLARRSEWPAGFYVGLHRHDGDEAFYVLEGKVRFTVDGEQIVCGAGEAATVPKGAEHGFRVLEDAAILIIREQHLGSVAIVIEPDGTRGEVEILQHGPPWSKVPPEGVELTPDEVIRSYYETTQHLI